MIRLPNGSQAVRLHGIDVQPGPRGSQSYPVPRDRTGRPPVTVLIWCRDFDTPVANATIR